MGEVIKVPFYLEVIKFSIYFIALFLLIANLIIGNTKKESTKTKKSNKSNKTKEEEQKIFVEAGLKLMAKVMAADRANMVCELDIIKQFIKKYDEAHFRERVNEVKEFLRRHKKNEIKSYEHLGSLVSTINETSNFTRKKWFLEYLFEIAFADGYCGDEEKAFLKSVVEKMDGMTSSTYNFMEKKYQKQNKNFTGTRDTQEFSEYEYEYENQSNNESGNKYNSYSSHGYSYSGKYSYQSSSNTSDNKDSNNSQEQQRRPLTELEKAYAALDLTEAATDKEIKARRRNLMRLNHPDLVMQKGEAAIRSANLRCQEINKAFELIKATRGMK